MTVQSSRFLTLALLRVSCVTRSTRTRSTRKRCFPHCCPDGHRQAGFCGSPIRAKLLTASGAAYTHEDLASIVIYGGLQCDEQAQLLNFGSRVQEADFAGTELACGVHTRENVFEISPGNRKGEFISQLVDVQPFLPFHIILFLQAGPTHGTRTPLVEVQLTDSGYMCLGGVPDIGLNASPPRARRLSRFVARSATPPNFQVVFAKKCSQRRCALV
jgi:hypothetical protein